MWLRNGDVLTPRQLVQANELSCTLIVRIFELAAAFADKCGKDGFGRLFGKSFWTLVYSSLLAPAGLGFDVRKEEVQRGLKETTTRFFFNCGQCLQYSFKHINNSQ
jgi:hypothetical protein